MKEKYLDNSINKNNYRRNYQLIKREHLISGEKVLINERIIRLSEL